MREIHSTTTLKAVGDHAAYVLLAEDTLSNYRDLFGYLDYAASRPLPHSIRPQLTSSHSSPDSLCAKLLEQKQDDGLPHTELKRHQKLLIGGGIKDWPLTAIEVLPGEWRFYLVNHGLARRFHAAIQKARQSNPSYGQKTNLEIAAAEQIAPFFEVFVCRAANPVLGADDVLTVSLDVPRRGGTDVYTLGFSAECTTIGETAGLGQRYLKIQNDADPAEYMAEVIEVQ